jgi:hypothetical protein
VGDAGESSIGFYRNGGGTIGAAGDQWVMGQGSWGSGDRGFAIGANGIGLCLLIERDGTVRIPNLIVGLGYSVQKKAWISCKVNSSSTTLPTLSNQKGGT